jgi:hypothetical protein
MKHLLWIVAPLLFGILLASPVVAAQEGGGISEVMGGVDILKGGKLPAEPVKVGDKVNQGDVIRTKTGAKTQIRFNDDSILTIAPNTRVAVNEFVYNPENNQRQATLKIFHGLVHTLVNKVFKQDKPDFIVETQTAVIGVRGTDYYTLAAPVNSDIYNNSGISQVTNIFPEIPGVVQLKGKEYTQVAANRPPTLPLPLSDADIDWLKKQMTGFSGPSYSGILPQKPRIPNEIIQPNAVQNLQSPIYVPPQPIAPSHSHSPPSPPPSSFSTLPTVR